MCFCKATLLRFYCGVAALVSLTHAKVLTSNASDLAPVTSRRYRLCTFNLCIEFAVVRLDNARNISSDHPLDVPIDAIVLNNAVLTLMHNTNPIDSEHWTLGA
ncbi:uncharacterized protein EV422DRAFT_76300 [Fimicolochytrium jonesii]|uniref:uncharacterized protein n=1 Tax=Fimicolochytrium jonesii TaxID=1396493 RepID=UPI0022FEA7C1|nr:uncharacterized protein EV422DRAFT_76300 [Fimicolochytrium jonesii]KAI8820562.1 hypothetical protein EV422DRAFT_76300 [Fimicolochytrium jonesii]